MNRIEKRAIEAQAIAPIIQAVAARIGWDETMGLLTEINENEAYARGHENAVSEDALVIDALADEVQSWWDGGSAEVEVMERTDTSFAFNVTRCPYHEKYRELGLEALGVALSCCRDEPHARGYHPRLRLTRSNTLMEGADCCDFRYWLAPGAVGE